MAQKMGPGSQLAVVDLRHKDMIGTVTKAKELMARKQLTPGCSYIASGEVRDPIGSICIH